MSSVSTNIRTYRLDPIAFEPTTKRRIFRRLAWSIPFIAILVGIQFVVMGKVQQGLSETLTISIPIIVATLAFGMFRAVRLQLKNGRLSWDSYELTMSDNVIRRHVVNLPAVEILRPEVTKIVDAPGEGITVATSDRHRFIFIPKQVVGYEEVHGKLAAWKELEPAKIARNRTISVAWTVLLIGSWIGTGIIQDIRLAMLSGIVLLAVGAITIRETIKVRVAENKAKAAAIGGLALMLLAPFARLILHFAFHMNVGWH